MPEQKEKVSSKNFFKERILRYPIVVFIRKNRFLFSFLLILAITFLLGLWNISRLEINELKGGDLDKQTQEKIIEYMEENIYGQNYFQLLPNNVGNEMYLNIAQIREIRVEKVIPNKVVLFLEEYEPKYAALLKNKNCSILSNDGALLKVECEDVEDSCCEEYAAENSLIYFTSPDVEVSIFDDEKDRLLIMEQIAKAVKVVETFRYNIDSITLSNNILEIIDEEGRTFRFSTADDMNLQLKRFIVVVAKVKSEYMEIGSLDLRFERPVMKQ